MMMMLIFGLLFLLLGLVCGGAITVAPLGLTRAPDSFAILLMFPAFCVLGYLFLLLNVRSAQIVQMSRLVGGALLLLAMAAAVMLVLFATGIKVAEASTLPLWLVLGVGVIFGSAGMALKSNKDIAVE